MVLKRTFILSVLTFFSINVVAEDTKVWYPITDSNSTAYFAKAGTFQRSKNTSSILVQITDKLNNKTSYAKVYMTDQDCDNGYGVISFYTLRGALDFNSDYVSQGQSVGAGIGDFICGVRNELRKQGRK
ncbi:hypothetical protein [Kosakonia pseudosacchari]|uniref:hypothetical protein n=1 Tax=Kosakonia pseudosacchari TaxID=1646340 RepID=UPI000A3CF49E|nr:hypothetical protein [Kosakonia pseudosacchari]